MDGGTLEVTEVVGSRVTRLVLRRDEPGDEPSGGA